MRVKLSDITHYSKGSQINREDLIDTGEYIYLNGGINPSGRWTASNVDANTITISEGGNSSGYINYITEPFWCGAHCYYLFDGPKNTKYLYYALKSQQERLFAIRSGACMPNIKKADLGKFEFEFDYDEKKQDEVVSVLSSTENIINNRKKELEKLDELIRARFVELFENGDYKTEKLGSVCTKITDGTHKTPTYLDEGITFISAKNIVNGELDFSDVKHISEEEYQEIQKRCQTAIYDILLSKSGSLGAPVIVKTEEKLGLFESLAVIKYDREKLLPEFLCEQLKTDRIQRQFTTGTKGVAIKHLHLGVIAETDVIVPPIEEQRQFADFVKQVNKSKFQKYNATILSHNIYVFETRRRFICKPTLII